MDKIKSRSVLLNRSRGMSWDIYSILYHMIILEIISTVAEKIRLMGSIRIEISRHVELILNNSKVRIIDIFFLMKIIAI